MYAGPKQPSLYEVIDRITINMHEITDMKEIQCALISNNVSKQYT